MHEAYEYRLRQLFEGRGFHMYVHSKVLARYRAVWCYNVTVIWRSNEDRSHEKEGHGTEHDQHQLHSRSNNWSIGDVGRTVDRIEQANEEQDDTFCPGNHSRKAG